MTFGRPRDTGLYVLRGHEPIMVTDTVEWGKCFQSKDRQVARTKVGEAEVSTVFLGMDHSLGGSVPILFETMVFGGKLDEEMERYRTWDEAEAGHTAMVARVRATLGDDK